MFDLFEFFTQRCREAEFAEDFQLSVTVIFDVNCTIEAATNGVDPLGRSNLPRSSKTDTTSMSRPKSTNTLNCGSTKAIRCENQFYSCSLCAFCGRFIGDATDTNKESRGTVERKVEEGREEFHRSTPYFYRFHFPVGVKAKDLLQSTNLNVLRCLCRDRGVDRKEEPYDKG